MDRASVTKSESVSDLKSQFQVVDLFAGVGGLSYGFAHRKEFKVLAANEILRPMAEAYRLNHPTTKMFEGDIKEFGHGALRATFGKELPKIDVVVGGPPCQAYSTVGKRLLDDPRASLFQEYFRILQELKPKVFIFENVKGLVSMNGGELMETIVSLFGTLNYKISFSVLNSADFGAPQTRERVIIVGTQGSNSFMFPNQTHRNANEPISLFTSTLPTWITLGDAIGDLPIINANESSTNYAFAPQNDFQRKMRKGAPKLLMDHNAANHGDKLINLMDHLPEGGGPKDLPAELRPNSGFPNTYCRLWWDRPSTTVTRNLGTPSSSRCIHPFLSRGLTTREGARIQCFPDSYRFYGSRTEKNLQIGNAVPTFLSEQLSSAVLKHLSQ